MEALNASNAILRWVVATREGVSSFLAVARAASAARMLSVESWSVRFLGEQSLVFGFMVSPYMMWNCE
jgi:hypothetical protein